MLRLPSGLFHFPCCIVYWWEASVTQNCTQYNEISKPQPYCKSTDTNGTMQGVSWHFTQLHQHLQPFCAKKTKKKTYRHKPCEDVRRGRLRKPLSLRSDSSEEDKRDERLPIMPSGKTNSCGCWLQQNSWGESENSRHVSHGHSWPVIQIMWLTQQCLSEGTATDVSWPNSRYSFKSQVFLQLTNNCF